jgi:hypothetical protein
MTLPAHWKKVFVAEAQASTMLEWDMNFAKTSFNVPVEKEIFTVL